MRNTTIYFLSMVNPITTILGHLCTGLRRLTPVALDAILLGFDLEVLVL